MDRWTDWIIPRSWPKAAAAHVSIDGQVYKRCSKCGREARVMHDLAEHAELGARCGACQGGADFVRHLRQLTLRCRRCGQKSTTSSSGADTPRCSNCHGDDLDITDGDIIPPFPPQFDEAIASHTWGVSGEADAEAIASELSLAQTQDDPVTHALVSTRLCRRLREYGGYENPEDHEFVRNLEANVLRNCFRASGRLPIGVAALALFEEGMPIINDPKTKALEQHNCAMAIYSMLSRHSERDVILATGRPDVRAAGIAYAERALAFFAKSNDEASRVQAARILHILGDLLAAGAATAAERARAIQHLETALAMRGLPDQLRQYLEMSRVRILSNDLTVDEDDEEDDDTDDEASFDNPEKLEYEIIGLDGSPEEVAASLIRGSLPKTFIDEIDISTQEGLGRFFACLMLRRNQASLEKDEIIRFVDRNRAALEGGALELLEKLAEVGAKVEDGEELANFFNYVLTQLRAALAGRPQDIDVKSDRLLWLVYALASQVSGGKLPYADALQILSKPEHRQRISSLSLLFMLKDFGESLGETSQVSTEYVLLIIDCALISGDVPAASAGAAIASKLPAPRDSRTLVDVFTRARAFLATKADDVLPEIDRALARYRARFGAEIRDDDF